MRDTVPGGCAPNSKICDGTYCNQRRPWMTDLCNVATKRDPDGCEPKRRKIQVRRETAILYLSSMDAVVGEVPATKAERMPLSSSEAWDTTVLRRALSAGGNAALRLDSVAGSPRQKRASSGLPATAATAAMRAAVLQHHPAV